MKTFHLYNILDVREVDALVSNSDGTFTLLDVSMIVSKGYKWITVLEYENSNQDIEIID